MWDTPKTAAAMLHLFQLGLASVLIVLGVESADEEIWTW